MIQPPEDPDPIEAMVRDHLTRQIQPDQGRKMLTRIRASLEDSLVQTDPPVQRLERNLTIGSVFTRVCGSPWTALVTASVLLLGVGLFYLGSSPAEAKSIVFDAKKVHALPIDRCYRVEIKRNVEWVRRELPRPLIARDTLLWTRGDRFWIESIGNRRCDWGRDAEGTVWLALSPHLGVRYLPEDVPERLALGCEIYSMQLDTLLGEVLSQFDLKREMDDGQQPGIHTIRAELRQGSSHPNLHSVELEIIAESRVVRRAVLQRTFRGYPSLTIEFNLVETTPQSDDIYQLEGHLKQPYRIYDRESQPDQRRQLLSRGFEDPTL